MGSLDGFNLLPTDAFLLPIHGPAPSLTACGANQGPARRAEAGRRPRAPPPRRPFLPLPLSFSPSRGGALPHVDLRHGLLVPPVSQPLPVGRAAPPPPLLRHARREADLFHRPLAGGRSKRRPTSEKTARRGGRGGAVMAAAACSDRTTCVPNPLDGAISRARLHSSRDALLRPGWRGMPDFCVPKTCIGQPQMHGVVQVKGTSRTTKHELPVSNRSGWPFAPSGAGNQSAATALIVLR
jgi:hypothetical protein